MLNRIKISKELDLEDVGVIVRNWLDNKATIKYNIDKLIDWSDSMGFNKEIPSSLFRGITIKDNTKRDNNYFDKIVDNGYVVFSDYEGYESWTSIAKASFGFSSRFNSVDSWGVTLSRKGSGKRFVDINKVMDYLHSRAIIFIDECEFITDLLCEISVILTKRSSVFLSLISHFINFTQAVDYSSKWENDLDYEDLIGWPMVYVRFDGNKLKVYRTFDGAINDFRN